VSEHPKKETLELLEENPDKVALKGKFRLMSVRGKDYPSFLFGDFDTIKEALEHAKIIFRFLVPGSRNLEVYDDTGKFLGKVVEIQGAANS